MTMMISIYLRQLLEMMHLQFLQQTTSLQLFLQQPLVGKFQNENFLKENETISNLKLRGSYGLTGNQALSPGQSLSQFNIIPSTTVGEQATLQESQPENDDLKWETSFQTNVGLDLGLYNNRVSLSFDYFNIDTEDLIFQAPVPLLLGKANISVFENIGEINNKGIEISLNTRNISNENFSWTTDLNFSTSKNEIIKLKNGTDIIGNAAPSFFSTSQTYILREGESIGSFWGLEFLGVFDGTNLPEGAAEASDAGDPLFADFDGDGIADQTIIGDPNPDFTFGITNNFSYKDFDLSVFFQGVVGGDILNLNDSVFNSGVSNVSEEFFEEFRAGNLPTLADRREISSRFVEDGTYVRLKNIALGYNLPKKMLNSIGLENVRLSVSAQNLLTFTDYSGPDPEVSFFGASGSNNTSSNVVQGHDFGNYPTIKSFNLGVNVKF